MIEPYYDVNDDWALIYASFQSQYGIRLSKDLNDMSWQEFAYLITGLSGESPLGKAIAIRAEKDPKKVKEFTPEQRKMRSEYLQKKAKVMLKKQADDAIDKMRQAFIGMVGQNEKAQM